MKKYEYSVTSQHGEDGVIAGIFKRIGTKNKVCVEVGAWDGMRFSNTWALREDGWTGVLAEADEERRSKIDTQPGVRVFGHCAHIDSMLDLYDIPVDFDVLSIDVDGDDYYLWEDMKRYHPRVVVIEYNQTVPPHISIVQKRGGNFGASMRAICELAEAKDYACVHVTTTNLIFVQKQYAGDFERSKYSFDWLQFIVTGYNGKKYLIGEDAHNDNQGGVHEELITDVKYRNV
jgi:hypothetical protein